MATKKQERLKQFIADFKKEVREAEQEVTHEEFVEAFQHILKFVKGMKQQNTSDVESMREVAKEETDKLTQSLTSKLVSLENEVKTALNQALSEQSTGMNFIHDKVKKLKDGKDADEEQMLSRLGGVVLSTVEKNRTSAEARRDSLEALEGEERIKLESIRGLVSKFEAIEDDVKKIKNRPAAVGSAVGLGSNLTELKATGDVDGSNADYVFSQKPTYINVNGSVYREGHGWEWSGLTATLDFNPATNSDVFGIL